MLRKLTPGTSGQQGQARNGLFSVAAALALVACCAAPALIAAGALTAIGGFLCNPLVIGAGAVLGALAVASIRRRKRGVMGDGCESKDQVSTGGGGR